MMQLYSNTTIHKIKRTIAIVAVSTMILSLYWGSFPQSPTYIKIIFSIGIWLAVQNFPYSLLKKNGFSKCENYLLYSLLALGLFQIFRSAFFPQAREVVIGNKYVSLFFNEYTSLIFIPPLFTFLGNSILSLKYLLKNTLRYIYIGLPFILLFKLSLAPLALYSIVFFPYVTKKNKYLIVFTRIESFLAGLTGGRMYLIVFFFSIMSYILVYVIKNSKLIYLFCFIFLVAPFLIVGSTMLFPNDGKSMFQIISSNVEDEEMNVDTRTFLYIEIAEDLTKNESWLLGKGAYSHYYSNYFSQNVEGGDNEDRLMCEVPFLLLLLRSGLLYVIIYFCIIIIAVFKAIKSRNNFVKSLGVIMIGWYFNSFIGDISGCRLQHLALFLLLGVCLSPMWREKNNSELLSFLK